MNKDTDLKERLDAILDSPDKPATTGNVTVRIDPRIHEAAKRLAEANKISLAELIEAALEKAARNPSVRKRITL